MLRFVSPAIVLAACSILPSMALELGELSLPLTRAEADKSLSKDYSFRVLEDMTVRRSWELENRTVSVDFSPKDGDQALLIFIDYTLPVSPDEADRDAGSSWGAEPGSWRHLLPKRAARLGMKEAEGLKLEGGRYCFRELDGRGHVVRLAYYAGLPGEVRWNLADDNRESGKTAMGARSVAGKSEFLWRDEERRHEGGAGVSPATAAAVETGAPAVPAETPTHASAAPSPKPAKMKMQERPKDPLDPVALVEEYVSKLTSTHYVIAGAVVALLLLLRVVSHVREAKKRAQVAEYIMNRGKRARGRKRGM